MQQKHLPVWFFLMLCVLLGCGACGMNLRNEATHGASLAGDWRLQNADAGLALRLRTVLEQAQAKEALRERRQRARDLEHEGRYGIELPPPDADLSDVDKSADKEVRVPRDNWRSREQRRQNDELLNAVLPAAQLQIQQSAQRIDMLPVGSARRVFDMGERSTLVRSYATLSIESGWQANQFVVHSRDAQRGIEVLERYTRLGDRLQLQVQVNFPDAKQQIYTVFYQLQQT